MIIELDMNSSIPIYVQLRNQIVMGIGHGELKPGESLPTVRQLAEDAGVNTMTVNKTYQILKTEGYINIDRRHGAVVAKNIEKEAARAPFISIEDFQTRCKVSQTLIDKMRTMGIFEGMPGTSQLSLF